MAVEWTEAQETKVEDLLRSYPASTGRCANLARELLPIAQEQDKEAHGLLIRPKDGKGYFVAPKIGVNRLWHHHATVGVQGHCVDALTGKSGTEREKYLSRHWQYPEALCIERNSLEDEFL